MNKKRHKHLINNQIKALNVRLGDDGIISISEALKIANDASMDLVLVNENSNPPVCKLMNYEKYIYEQNKKNKVKSLDIKEIKLSLNISDNDINYRIKHIREFLSKGHKVKITLQFKGREMTFIDNGNKIILDLLLKIDDVGVPENMPKMEGKKMFTIVKPKIKR